MPKSFVLKDAPPELIAAAQVEPKGRKYDKNYAEKPGGIRLEEVLLGLKLACVAITDDEEGTLAKVGKMMPWHIEALTVITGSEEEAHKPLTSILNDHFNLKMDKFIDISGWAGRYPLDTQGYIAHNDEIIVLAYRCTTSVKDWLTNFTTTSSEWEPEIDIPQGHSGHCSCLSGLCCSEAEYKPRVHTGFYNNFLVTAPLIQEYIDPLLAPDQPPRKLFVVGHSLGAGIANMAACYFMLEHDWANLPHKFVCVTAGSPRSVMTSMREKVQEKMTVLGPLDKAVICRVVRDKDVVPTVPPAAFGFVHLEKLVYITKLGELLINPQLDDDHILTEKEKKKLNLSQELRDSLRESERSASMLSESEEGKEMTEYQRKVSRIPRPLRDHMPDFYLKPLIELFEVEAGLKPEAEAGHNPAEEEDDEEAPVPADREVKTKTKKRRFRLFHRGKKKDKVEIPQ